MSGELMATTPLQLNIIEYGTVISMWAALGLTILLAALSWRKIRAAFSRVSRKAWLALVLILFASLAFRLAFVPLTNRVYFDEDLYENMARNVLLEGRSCMCNWGDASACYDCIINKAPAAHPFLMALVFHAFGPSRAAGFAYSQAAFLASGFLMFLCTYLLFGKRERPALLSALLINLLPVAIVWSNTIAAETTFLFLSLLSFLSLLLFSEGKEQVFLLLLGTTLAMAIQSKAETGVLLPLFYLAAAILAGPRATLLKPAFYASAALVLLLSAPHLLHVYLGATKSSWGATGAKFSREYFGQNLPVNAGFFLFGYPAIEHPLLLSALAVAGTLVLLAGGRRRAALVLLLWFLSLFLLYAAFYAGSVRYGTDVRYVVSYYAPFAIAASAFALLLPSGRHLAAFSVLLCAYFLVAFYPSVSTPAPRIAEANQARSYAEFARDVRLPENCTIFSHVTSLHIDLGRTSAQPWYLQDPALRAKALEKAPCAIFDYGFWCTVPPFKGGQCRQIMDKNPAAKLMATDPTGQFSYYLLPA